MGARSKPCRPRAVTTTVVSSSVDLGVQRGARATTTGTSAIVRWMKVSTRTRDPESYSERAGLGRIGIGAASVFLVDRAI